MEQMVPLRPASLEPLRAKAFGFWSFWYENNTFLQRLLTNVVFTLRAHIQTGYGQFSQDVMLESSMLEEDGGKRSRGVD